MFIQADPSDPNLVKWRKADSNPVIPLPPSGLGTIEGFRDPTTAWRTADGKWNVLIGTRSQSPLVVGSVFESVALLLC